MENMDGTSGGHEQESLRCLNASSRARRHLSGAAAAVMAFEALPEELALEVARKCDMVSLCRSRQVSRRWQLRIDSDVYAWARVFPEANPLCCHGSHAVRDHSVRALRDFAEDIAEIASGAQSAARSLGPIGLSVPSNPSAAPTPIGCASIGCAHPSGCGSPFPTAGFSLSRAT